MNKITLIIRRPTKEEYQNYVNDLPKALRKGALEQDRFAYTIEYKDAKITVSPGTHIHAIVESIKEYEYC